MLSLILLVFLIALSMLVTVLLTGAWIYSRFELQRRARAGDALAELVFPLRNRANELRTLLFFIAFLADVLIVLVLADLVPGTTFWANFLTVIIAVPLLVLVTKLIPAALWRSSGLRLTARLAPVFDRLLDSLRPVLRPFGEWLDKHLGEDVPAVHSPEELVHLLEQQANQDTTLTDQELKLVKQALQFSDKQVSDVMTPRSVMTGVEAKRVLSPGLLKELHDSGHSRFPVYEKTPDQIIGILYMHELVERNREKVLAGEAAEPGAHYVHEQDSLEHALHGFLRTRHHLFIVVNDFEETVGLISMEDVLEQILGRKIVDEFDQYDDLRAVAARQGKQRVHEAEEAEEKTEDDTADASGQS